MVNIDFLTRQYFYFDEPVPYKLRNHNVVYITPISLKDSEIFMSSIDILGIDKNTFPDASIIQMSYLEFIIKVLFADSNTRNINIQKLLNILILSLGMKSPTFIWENDMPYIVDTIQNIKISPKQFDEIKKIIMHQNFIHYDDSYINPDLKQAMDEVDELKNQNIDYPSIERKMAIITSHCGLPKREQQLMTYRSHNLLFEEVCGEVEFTTIRPVALFSGSKSEIDHWIFKKRRNKFDGYTKSIDAYTQSMGGAQAIKSSDTSLGDSYMQQLNNFN